MDDSSSEDEICQYRPLTRLCTVDLSTSKDETDRMLDPHNMDDSSSKYNMIHPYTENIYLNVDKHRTLTDPGKMDDSSSEDEMKLPFIEAVFPVCLEQYKTLSLDGNMSECYGYVDKFALMYVWKADGKSWGHVSLWLDDGYGTYISWWPRQNKSKNKLKKKKTKNIYKEKLPENYREDVGMFTMRECTEVFLIRKDQIDVSDIRAWWKSYMKDKGYNFFGRNCCHCVTEALAIGGVLVLKSILPVKRPYDMIALGNFLENEGPKW